MMFPGCGRLLPHPQLKRAWDAWQAGRWQGGEISQRPGYTNHAFRLRNDHSCHRNTSSRNWTL